VEAATPPAPPTLALPLADSIEAATPPAPLALNLPSISQRRKEIRSHIRRFLPIGATGGDA